MIIEESRFSDDRIVRHHRPGVWIGSIRRAFGPVADDIDEAGVFESRPPNYLIALWKPLRRNQAALPRWPRKALLVMPDVSAALTELLRDIPSRDLLWITEQEIDWGLVADIVMLSETRLEAYQQRELERFVVSEREATLAAIRGNYRGSEVFPGQYELSVPGQFT